MLSKTYLLQDYITKVKKEHEEIFFLAGMNDKGKILTFDLMKLTHTFIAGMQGGGKSNLLNVIIQSLMYFNDNIFYIMCDFKGGVELSQYEKFKNTILVEDLKDLNEIIDKIIEEMDERYKKLKASRVKKIKQYNDLNKKNPMPYIVFIIDEMSDIKLSLNSESIEKKLTIILNKGRASGILGLFATQRPGSKQVSTDIRDRFGTKISARIVDTRTQEMAGIKGTENLKDGEFMMKFIETLYRYKAFFIDDIKYNKVYEILSNNLEGDNIDNIFIKSKKE
ncbi:MAG: DNA translocase FtsK [Calditrichaeota bacterium]|nr:MAG: DNA translocase FtsK [Calditrichota bacterium]